MQFVNANTVHITVHVQFIVQKQVALWMCLREQCTCYAYASLTPDTQNQTASLSFMLVQHIL